jgi:Spy/CpxP family protein refolding chaperone
MSDNRTRIWFSLFVLVVFCVGMAGGMLIGRRMAPPPPPAGMFPGEPGPGRGRGPGPGPLIDRLDREVQLTPEQRTRVQAIFDARRGRLEEVQREVIARAEEERRALQDEIRKVLTPEQQARFDRWIAEQPLGRGRGRGRGF